MSARLRRWCASMLAVCAVGGWSQASAQRSGPTITVLCSLPEVLAKGRLEAFERANPDLRVDLRIQRAASMAASLRAAAPGQRPDLIWTAGDTLQALQAEGLLAAPESEDASGTPAAALERATPAGPGRSVRHTIQLSIQLQPDFTEAPNRGPQRWIALAEAAYAGQLWLPLGDRAGAGVVLAEALLQGEGWEQGWALLAQLAGNSVAFGSESARGDAGSGRAPFSLRVGEANAAAEPAGGSPRVLPVASMLAHSRAAIVAGAREARLAQRLVRFLADAAIAPSPLVSAPGPARLPLEQTRQYQSLDLAVLERRQRVVGALIEQALVVRHAELKSARAAIEDARRRGGAGADSLRRAQALIDAAPIDAAALASEPVLAAFGDSGREAARRVRAAALEAQWSAQAADRYAQVQSALRTDAAPVR